MIFVPRWMCCILFMFSSSLPYSFADSVDMDSKSRGQKSISGLFNIRLEQYDQQISDEELVERFYDILEIYDLKQEDFLNALRTGPWQRLSEQDILLLKDLMSKDHWNQEDLDMASKLKENINAIYAQEPSSAKSLTVMGCVFLFVAKMIRLGPDNLRLKNARGVALILSYIIKVPVIAFTVGFIVLTEGVAFGAAYDDKADG